MKVLKSKTFTSDKLLTIFINENNILKEDILAITCCGDLAFPYYTILFYGDSEEKEKTHGIFG